MDIEHVGHYSRKLDKYQIDRFEGEWETKSKGKVKDFNLMCKGCVGDFFYCKLDPS